MSKEKLFLGLDSSTQGLKATLINEALEVVCEDAINFDESLPEFKTEGGVHRHEDGLTVTSPPLMWVAALDVLLDKIKDDGWPLEHIAAVSGSGQQHGSVWLRRGARRHLQSLDPQEPLADQLADAFAVEASPVWMDSSTGSQCAALEQSLGGAQAVADLTGSRAYERFTGNQIAKIALDAPDAYQATERVCLVSSFMATLLRGDYVPIDASDGAGMNLMDYRKRAWAPRALQVTAPELADRLGEIVPSHTVVGPVSAYYVKRYGFSSNCRVVAFSGDNPNSLAGLRLGTTGDVAISLGTSDTLFATLQAPVPSGSEGHIFPSPVDPKAYMAMICRKNGSLTREYIRDRVAEGNWDIVNKLLARTPAGNEGCMGVYLREPEITPPILEPGVHRYDAAGDAVVQFDAATEVRAMLEGQFLSLRLHAEAVGIDCKRIIATGGASVNTDILQVIADVFGADVFIAERSDSASLGAAYRALHGDLCENKGTCVPFAEVEKRGAPFQRAVEANPGLSSVYAPMLKRMAKIEAVLAV